MALYRTWPSTDKLFVVLFVCMYAKDPLLLSSTNSNYSPTLNLYWVVNLSWVVHKIGLKKYIILNDCQILPVWLSDVPNASENDVVTMNNCNNIWKYFYSLNCKIQIDNLNLLVLHTYRAQIHYYYWIKLCSLLWIVYIRCHSISLWCTRI